MGRANGRRPSFTAHLRHGSLRHELTEVPYFVLMTGISPLAMSLCAPAAKWNPSGEIKEPNVAVALVKIGKRGMALVARFAARIGFGSI